jgi:hypothetical protein
VLARGGNCWVHSPRFAEVSLESSNKPTTKIALGSWIASHMSPMGQDVLYRYNVDRRASDRSCRGFVAHRSQAEWAGGQLWRGRGNTLERTITLLSVFKIGEAIDRYKDRVFVLPTLVATRR